MIITIKDFRPDICRDARHWFAKNGLDWRDFVKNGIDSKHLWATGEHGERIATLEARAKRRLED